MLLTVPDIHPGVPVQPAVGVALAAHIGLQDVQQVGTIREQQHLGNTIPVTQTYKRTTRAGRATTRHRIKAFGAHKNMKYFCPS